LDRAQARLIDMTPGQLAAIGPLIFSLVLLVALVPGAIRSWRTYAGVGARRQEDATGRAPDPSPDRARRIATCEALGYRPLGETVTRIPGGDVFGNVLAADDGLAYVLLADGPPEPGLTGFYTAWPDGTWLGTIHPRGAPLEIPGLSLHIETGAMPTAEAAHRELLTRLAQRHGPPRLVRSLTDVFALDADYRTRFGGRELRPLVIRAIAPAAGALLLTLISVALVLVAR
jgi:hypothetical protein